MGRTSIRRRLLVSLISTIIILWLIAAAFVYQVASHEVEEVYDATLAQEARILATLMVHEVEENIEINNNLQILTKELNEGVISESSFLRKLIQKYQTNDSEKDYLTLVPRDPTIGHRYEAKIALLVKDADGKTYLRSNVPTTFNEFKEGYSNYLIENENWRIFGLYESKGTFYVQVGEMLSLREETVSEIVINSLWPIIISLPLIGFFIWILVGGGLKPLKIIAGSVENRDPNALDPITTESVPREVVPMVQSLNRLFLRVQAALENERRFTADAAHELRTPLAALKTLAQAKSLVAGNSHAGFLDQIVRGVDRTTHLLEQLLILARMDSQSMDKFHTEAVDLQRETINIISSIANSAITKEIDISYDGPSEPVVVNGYPPAIQILLRNIIDNAIRYTPKNGVVCVRLTELNNGARVDVIDTGPGIPEEQQQSIYQRFRRGENVINSHSQQGSGLGLAIVKRIIELHQATIEMINREDQSGLKVMVTFPRRK
jgi:two-component system, OmpR family, sensor histidine kinase QseC